MLPRGGSMATRLQRINTSAQRYRRPVAARAVAPSSPGSARRQPKPHQRPNPMRCEIIQRELTRLRSRPEAIVLWGVWDDCTGRTRAIVNHQDVLGIQPNRDRHRKQPAHVYALRERPRVQIDESDAIHGDLLDGWAW